MASGLIKSTACVLTLVLASPAVAQLPDPLPEPVSAGELGVRIVDWVQVPSSGNPPLPARINLAHHAPDSSGRLFVNDQRGLLHVISNDQISLYLNLNETIPEALSVSSFGNGFHSFAFHPGFASNGMFYTVHMEDPSTGTADLLQQENEDVVVHSVVTEWIANVPSDNVFSGAHSELLRIEQPRFAHTIQEIGFNPNALPVHADYGMLYIGQGDGARFVTDRPQSLDSPHGSLLRIDPSGNNSPSGRYGIPADNPFASDGDPQTLGEIWAYGFRNPHRFSWDTQGDQKMLIGDIGQANIEEINLGAIGENYGWNEREGTFLLDTSAINDVFELPPDDAVNDYRYPVAQYDHDEGSAVVGGFVYRSTAIPELAGQYLFGDIVNGRIFYVDVDYLVQGRQATVRELQLIDDNGLATNLLSLVNDTRADLRFGLTEDQEIVVLTKTDGMMRRLESLSPSDSDGDGVADPVDNCQLVANSSQYDADLDGFGNACDTDTDNNCTVNFIDVSAFANSFLGTSAVHDFDGNGVVNFLDLIVLSNSFLGVPGPSAIGDCP